MDARNRQNGKHVLLRRLSAAKVGDGGQILHLMRWTNGTPNLKPLRRSTGEQILDFADLGKRGTEPESFHLGLNTLPQRC